jgi:hypothetical protein
MRRALLTIAASLAAVSASAADRPPAMPAGDATVVYDVLPDNHPAQQVRVYFGHRGDLLRVDGPAGEGDTVLDRTTGTLTVVINASHAFMVIPSKSPVPDPFLLDPAADYKRTGTSQTIASVPCTDWLATSKQGHAQVCISDDGLLLAAKGVDGTGASGQVRAVKVSTGPLAPDLFTPPSSYQRIAHPAGQP